MRVGVGFGLVSVFIVVVCWMLVVNKASFSILVSSNE